MTQTLPVMGTGRRKTTIARAKVIPGTGKISVNGKSVEDFFGGLSRHKKEALSPMQLCTISNNYDFIVDVVGGGITGHAGAIRHAISRALIKIDPKLRASVKKAGFLTRDPRMVERKKPGRPKARKRFQFSKR